MFDTIFQNTSKTNLSINIGTTLLIVLASLFLGLVVSFAYYLITDNRNRSASFIVSLIILPAIVSIVIILVGENVARAFSLAGIFTLVRFRSLPGDSRDISFVFLSMAVGLTVGLGYVTLGAAVTIILGAAIVIVSKLGYGVPKQREKRLKITIPEDMNYENAFDDVFTKYTKHCEMIKVKTTNMGTLFELVYEIMMKDGMSEKEFIDAIRCRNGNLMIQIGLKDTSGQQL